MAGPRLLSAFDHHQAVPWTIERVKLITDISVFSPSRLHAAGMPAPPICSVTLLLSATSLIFHLCEEITSMALIPPTVSQLHCWGDFKPRGCWLASPQTEQNRPWWAQTGASALEKHKLGFPVLLPATSFYNTCGKLWQMWLKLANGLRSCEMKTWGVEGENETREKLENTELKSLQFYSYLTYSNLSPQSRNWNTANNQSLIGHGINIR